MQHFWSLEDVNLLNSRLTIGSFDGVHLGHQEIVRRLTAGAHKVGAPAVVLTFFPHPAVVLGKRSDPTYLTTPEERAEILGEMSVDVVITHPFNRRVASTTAHDFLKVLYHHLSFSHLLVGPDFALGRNREGDVPALKHLASHLGYVLEVMPPFKLEGEVVSSSQVRAALASGDVGRAALLLGRPYRLRGEVVLGDGRGRQLGIPTANLLVWQKRALPKSGVYVCLAQVKGKTWGAVSNIGVRPTFNSKNMVLTVEAHLLDFDAEIYGQEMRLDFLSRLRDEQRFPNVMALVEQIQRDIARAREILETLAALAP